MNHPFVFERTQILPITLDLAWDFFSDPRNLERITPPDMKFRTTSPVTDATYAGQIISYTLRPLFAMQVEWITEITHVNKPFFFVDEQRFGPYRFWHHQHFFQEVEQGVEMRDLVHYLLPHLHGAWLTNKLFVAPRLKRIFDYRRETLAEIFSYSTSSNNKPQPID